MREKEEFTPSPITPFRNRALAEKDIPREDALKRMDELYRYDPSSYANKQAQELNLLTDTHKTGDAPSCIYYAKYTLLAARNMGLDGKIYHLQENDGEVTYGHTYVVLDEQKPHELAYNLDSYPGIVTVQDITDHPNKEDGTEEVFTWEDWQL